MNVTCPDCRSVFRVDPAKVPDVGVRARCNVCGGVIAIATDEQRDAAPPIAEHAALFAGTVAPAAAPAVAGPDPVAPAPPPTSSNVEPPPVTPDAELLATTPAERRPEAPPNMRPARPVNPYLNNTPELRARRLARALVSDLVAYNPQKREEGLRNGTLRQLFRDEIRKSWDEYVEQVGANVAESTPHFQDALNDVLAGGRRVF